MPHNYNRAAFQSVVASGNALVVLYLSLVDLEIALKDHFSGTAWRSGHRIIDWIAEVGEASLSVQLDTALAILPCTARDGTEAHVAGNSYPHYCPN